MSDAFVPLGEIVAAHALGGWLKLFPYNPHTTNLSQGNEVFLDKGGRRAPHRIESIRPHRRHLFLKLSEIDTREQAEGCIGAVLLLREEALQSLEPGEYYHYQVIGLEVVTTGGERIGKVTGILLTAAGVIYAVAGESKEHLIPAVKEIVDKVDQSAGILVINPPAGLLDL
ncbi:MAG TPA: ribosome maturation factor RimM [Candidatus Eisenbacteria bacterium]|nr:ribosome maturation factor RimM [Candidatus Eisenbacteria bacterium]